MIKKLSIEQLIEELKQQLLTTTRAGLADLEAQGEAGLQLLQQSSEEWHASIQKLVEQLQADLALHKETHTEQLERSVTQVFERVMTDTQEDAVMSCPTLRDLEGKKVRLWLKGNPEFNPEFKDYLVISIWVMGEWLLGRSLHSNEVRWINLTYVETIKVLENAK